MIDIYVEAPGKGKDVADGLNAVDSQYLKTNASDCSSRRRTYRKAHECLRINFKW